MSKVLRALLAVALCAELVHADESWILANASWGELVRLEPTTGKATVLPGVVPPTGTFYEVTTSLTGRVYQVANDAVRSVDPYTGFATKLGSIPPVSVRGTAVDVAGKLYYATTDVNGPPVSRLWSWTEAAGPHPIGIIALGGVQALAFAPDGTLYGWAAGLVTIDPATAVAQMVNPALVPGLTASIIQFLAIDRDGVIYGGCDALYRLSTVAGVAPVQIGAESKFDLRGGSFFTSSTGFENYGRGAAGALGVPALMVDAPPVLGTTIHLLAGNSAGVTTPAVIVYGSSAAQASAGAGMTLLVAVKGTTALTLPPGTTTLPLAIPLAPALMDVSFFLQSFEHDFHAANGFASASRGLRLTLGR